MPVQGLNRPLVPSMGRCVSYFGGSVVIVLRRLGGGLFALNPDLVERVEATPDTVVTLVDDKKFLIEEDLETVLQLITDYRAYIIVRSTEMAVTNDPGRPTLHVVPNEHVTTLENSLEPGVDLDFGDRGSNDMTAWLDEVDAAYPDGEGGLDSGNGNGDAARGNVVSDVSFGSERESANGGADGSIDSGFSGGGR